MEFHKIQINSVLSVLLFNKCASDNKIQVIYDDKSIVEDVKQSFKFRDTNACMKTFDELYKQFLEDAANTKKPHLLKIEFFLIINNGPENF